MKIIGVGAGPGLLTKEAIKAIENARIIFGSKTGYRTGKRTYKMQSEYTYGLYFAKTPRKCGRPLHRRPDAFRSWEVCKTGR